MNINININILQEISVGLLNIIKNKILYNDAPKE
jgi:hypothetical protein